MSGRGPVSDLFEHDDAAYLLGALDRAGLAAFEAHLADCAGCAARIAALRPAVGALAQGDDAVRDMLALSLEAAVEPAEVVSAPQPDRVAWLAQLVERRRRRVRWAFGGLAAVAAAAVVALVVAVATPTAPAVTARQMIATGAAAIRATAAIAATPWGSEITIDCSYTGASQYASGDIYALEVVDGSGRSHEIGTWTLAQNTQARFTSGTALAPGQISAINVVGQDGTVVLRLSL